MNQITLTLGGSVELVLTPPKPQLLCYVTLWYRGLTLSARGDNMAYTLPADHFVKVQVSYTDSAGNPAQVDSIAWSSDPPSIISAQVGDDPSVLVITPVGPAGNGQVTATADVDMGDGVKPLVTVMDITIVAGEAVAGTIAPVGPAEPINS